MEGSSGHVKKVTQVLRNVEAKPVEGGAVVRPLGVLPDLWLIPWFCDPFHELVLRIVAPSVRVRWPKIENLTQEEGADGLYVGFPWASVWARRDRLARLAKAARALPQGSTVELMTANYEPNVKAGQHRYCGTLEDGRWRITHAAPAVSRNALEAALDQIAWVGSKGPLEAASEQEATAILAAADRSQWFSEDEHRPKVDGRRVTVQEDYREYLMLMLFRVRARDVWNLADAEREDHEERREWDEEWKATDEALQEAFGASHSGTVVYEGEASRFYEGDISSLPDGILRGVTAYLGIRDLEGGDEMPRGLKEDVRRVDEAMRALGFEPLGDLVAEEVGEVVLRGYAQREGNTYGVILAGTFGQFEFEFYSRLSNGASLTTSTATEGKAHVRKKKIFRRGYPGHSPEQLLGAHRKGLGRLTGKSVKPLPVMPSLEAFAQAVDEFLIRADGI